MDAEHQMTAEELAMVKAALMAIVVDGLGDGAKLEAVRVLMDWYSPR